MTAHFPPSSSRSMSRRQALALQLSNLAVVLTGLGYAACLYLVKPSDPFAVVNHPWQPHLQHLHVLAAPALVFMVGNILHSHALRRYRGRVKLGRRTGISLLILFVPMVASGYLLQVSVDETWRDFHRWTHLAWSLGWTTAYAFHWLKRG